MEKTRKAKFLIFSVLAAGLFAVFARSAAAAALYFSPSSGSYEIGKAFLVNVLVSSESQAMNAASGVISFPSDKLSVESVSKSGSIFGLWVQDPSFSNSTGVINFEGIVLNPGFVGAGGKILSINFRAKAAGVSTVSFSSGSVLANDGKGTNILSDLKSASFNLNQSAAGAWAPESTTPSETAGAPLAPVISSSSHPDPNKWYADSSPKFVWGVPSGVTAVRLLYDKFPTSNPTVTYSPAIREKALKDVSDGSWYFHARFKDANGWGAISHFRFQIDTKPPEPFEVKVGESGESASRPVILFNTTDSLSGIDYYLLKIGDGEFSTVKKDEVDHNPYTLPPQAPGKRTILVKALDRAGNGSVAASEIVVSGLEKPVVTDYPKELRPGHYLSIKGTTYPNIQLSIWFMERNGEPERYTAYSESDGSFSHIFPKKLEEGVYEFWLLAVNDEMITSEPTGKYTVVVRPSAVKTFVEAATGWLSAFIPFVILLFIFAAILWYGFHRFSAFRKRVKKETEEADRALHKVFALLKKDVREHIRSLESARSRRELTEEEEKIMRRLVKNLSEAEKFVGKEIEDIEVEAE